jgi:DME family drug/metabolite transporter
VSVVAAACLFGTTGTVLARGPSGADALGAGAVRLAVGGATLAVAARFERSGIADGWRRHTRWSIAGGAAVALYQLCFFVGTTRTGVALATVLTIGSGPVFSGIIDATMHRRPPPPAWLRGTAVSVTGVAVLGAIGGVDRVDALGVAAALISGLGWAIYATIGKHQIDQGLGSTVTMAAMFCAAAVIVSPLLFSQHIGWISRPSGALMAAYLGVLTVGVAYTLYGRALRHLTAPTVITLTLAEPLTAAVLGVLVLHEHLGPGGWAGVAAVACGLALTSRAAASSGAPGSEVATTVAV